MGSFPSTQEFRYLGSASDIHSSLKSDVGVNTRITKATAAFSALHYCFFSNQRVSLNEKTKAGCTPSSC